MTFLPIVERELRVAARRRSTYWSRWALALGAVLVSAQVYLWSERSGTPGAAGQGAFAALSWLALAIALVSAVFTADCLSSERREGTLGLLFLTDLKGYDVVFGKLTFVGLGTFYSLLGFLPALMIPLLAGGVTGGEAARTALALLNALMLSLASGIWISARKQEQWSAMQGALVLVATLVFAPLLLELLLRPFLFVFGGGMIAQFSPQFSFSHASDASYRAAPRAFWLALLCGQVESWLLLLTASRAVLRNWSEQRVAETPVAVTKSDVRQDHYRLANRAALLRTDPVCWLAERLRGQKALVWCGALLMIFSGGYWLVWMFFRSANIPLYMAYYSASNILFFWGSRVLFAWAACRFFLEVRRTGELELLMSTPLGAREIVSGQWHALWRLIRWPLALVVALGALQILPALGGLYASNMGGYYFAQVLGAMMRPVNAVLDVIALCWVGMWFGLTARKPAAALTWTCGLVIGLPWLILYGMSLCLGLLGGFIVTGSVPGLVWLWGYQFLPLLKNIFFILWARQRLRTRFRSAMAEPMSLRHSLLAGGRFLADKVQRARHWTPS